MGDSIIGSDATSYTRNPGGTEEDLRASAGLRAGELGCAFIAGRQMLPGVVAVPGIFAGLTGVCPLTTASEAATNRPIFSPRLTCVTGPPSAGVNRRRRV